MEKQDTKPARSNGKHPGGRPTKCTDQVIEALHEFFETQSDAIEYIDIPHYDAEGNVKWTDKKRMPARFPSIVQFWRWLTKEKGISIDWSTIYSWGLQDNDRYQPEFVKVYNSYKPVQRDCLVQGGLTSVYNPLFGRFVGMNDFGMVERSEKTIEAGQSLTDLYARAMAKRVESTEIADPGPLEAITGASEALPVLETNDE